MPKQPIIPPDTFIGQYLSFCEMFETARAFDLWGALYVLGNALGRDIVVRPSIPIRMNWYVTYVAESGRARKTTAVRIARKVLAHYLIGRDDFLSISTKTTPEKLVHDLSMVSAEYGCANATICIDEMVNFLGREKYTLAMPGILTDLYDCPDYQAGGGTLYEDRKLVRVFLSFLSASTPTWLASAINPDVIEGGFTSRTIFVVAHHPKKLIPWPEGDDVEPHYAGLASLLKATVDYAARQGSISISPTARTHFDKWYRTRKEYSDRFRSSFQAREHDHVLRLAGSLAVNDGTLVICKSHLLYAIKTIEAVRDSAADIFVSDGIIDPDLARIISKIIDILIQQELIGITQNDLTMRMKNVTKGRTIRTALGVLHDRGLVQQFQLPSSGGRPALLWRATQAIRQPNVATSIARALS